MYVLYTYRVANSFMVSKEPGIMVLMLLSYRDLNKRMIRMVIIFKKILKTISPV